MKATIPPLNMIPKKIFYSTDAREKILAGAEKLAKAVRVTMGSNGRNVLIRKREGNLVTKDGVTTANEIHLEDTIEDSGAQLVREAANKTNESTGDGTTTATILAYAIMEQGMKYMRKGANAILMKRGIDKAVEEVCNFLEEFSISVDNSQLKAIATISSQDEEIGKIVSEVMTEVGEDGIVTVEPQSEVGITKEYTDGMLFDSGYGDLFPICINDYKNATCILEDVPIIVTDNKIMRFEQVLKLLEELSKKGVRKIVVICETMDGGALASFISNVAQSKLEAAVIRAPLYDLYRQAVLEDIAAYTSATAFIKEHGKNIEDLKPEHLGYARRVIVSKDSTIIVNGGGEQTEVQKRIDKMKADVKDLPKDKAFDIDYINKRIARLSGGVGVIKVGAATEIERTERHHRVEDAIGATKSAWEEGIVPGSGVAYLRAIQNSTLKAEDKDEQTGIDIVKKALISPSQQIIQNCGAPKRTLKEVLKDERYQGYNGTTDRVEDLVVANVIDPKKVNRVALQNAASVASMFLTLECVVADIDEDRSEPFTFKGK